MIARTKFTIRVMQSHEMGGGREGKSSVRFWGKGSERELVDLGGTYSWTGGGG